MPLLALSIWPFVSLLFFRKYAFASALVISVLTGYLLLPERFQIDLPGLPALNKQLILMLAMLLAVLLYRKASGQRAIVAASPERINARPLWGWTLFALIALLFISPFFTIQNNRYQIVIGETVLQAARTWDMVGESAETLLFVIPFLIARRFLATPAQHRMLLEYLVIAGVLYSVLALIEMRLSPQFNKWIYGFYQHSFVQHKRGGGWRPMLFLRHGLWVGFFFCTVALAALALYRSEAYSRERRKKYLIAGIYLFLVLVMSRNLGATALALLFGAILFTKVTTQLRICMVFCIIFLLYPALRQAQIIPIEQIVNVSAKISEDRADSLLFRFDNEDALLERAWEKPLTGWGGWGRNAIYSETGVRTTTFDGTWIIRLSVYGWVGFVAFFALLVLPVLFLWRVARSKEIPIETAALAVIMTANILYLLPNSALSQIGWMMVGALAGFAQFDQKAETVSEQDKKTGRRSQAPRYTRSSTTRHRNPSVSVRG